MKKFVVVKDIGTWEKKDGKKVIDCTVKAKAIVFDTNDETEANNFVSDSYQTKYLDNGTWESFFVYRRKDIKRYTSLMVRE